MEQASLLVDGSSSANVDEEGQENEDPVTVLVSKDQWSTTAGGLPDRTVEGRDAHDAPLRDNPAPERSIAVHTLTLAVPQEEVNDGRHHRDTVANNEVRDLHSAQSAAVKLEVECEVHIDSHSKCPEGISRHEPRSQEKVSTVSYEKRLKLKDSHLNEEGLELAANRARSPVVGARHEGADIGQHVAKGGVED